MRIMVTDTQKMWLTGCLSVYWLEMVWLCCLYLVFTVRLHVMQRTVLLSLFCLSVCPSDACSDKINWTADILIPHETAITLVFWHQHWLVDDAPFLWNLRSKWPTPFKKRRPRHISAYNGSTVTYSEKSSITTNKKSTMGFPTSYGWSAYITSKSPKVWLKEQFFVFCVKVNFNRIKSATKFLYVKTSSGKVVVQPFPYLMVHRY